MGFSVSGRCLLWWLFVFFVLVFLGFLGGWCLLVDCVVECAAYECVSLVVHVVELGYEFFCCGWGVFGLVFWLGHVGSVRFSCVCILKGCG